MAPKSLPGHHPFRSAAARERYLTHYDAWASEWPVPAEVRMVATGHGETLVRICGPADAPPLVLLPSAKLHSLMWGDDVPLFSRHFRTYVVDAIYDSGRSVSSRPITTIPEATGWLDGLFDELGLTEGVNLMGASLGAWLAAEYVLHAPQRLAKAIWAVPPAVVLAPSKAWISRAMLAAVPSRATLGGLMAFTCPVASRSSGRSREVYERAVDDIVLGARCFRPRPFPGGPRVLADEELAGIRTPVLYMEGEHETICDAREAVTRLNAVAPQIETAIIEGADHSLSWVEPEASNQRILGFLGAATAVPVA